MKGMATMNKHVNRRHFIKSAGLVLAGMGAALEGASKGALKVSLNAYSFNKMLNDSIKGRGEGITLIQTLEFAAKNKFDGFDATGYYFPGYPAAPSDAYV